MNASDLWLNRPPWTSNIPNVEKWRYIRKHRRQLLIESDWRLLSDAPLTDLEKAQWVTYRRTLRNIPQTYTNPDDVVFPDPPESAIDRS